MDALLTRRSVSSTSWEVARTVGMFCPSRLLATADNRPITEEVPRLLLKVRHTRARRARGLIDALGRDWRDVLDMAPERVFGTCAASVDRRHRQPQRAGSPHRGLGTIEHMGPRPEPKRGERPDGPSAVL